MTKSDFLDKEKIAYINERKDVLEHLLKLTDLHAAINTVINDVVPDISKNTALKNLALNFQMKQLLALTELN
mgnify:CR=1 FL=1